MSFQNESAQHQVFFYGLFMDKRRLASCGVIIIDQVVACLQGYRLRIGERATVIADAESCVCGILATLSSEQLYSLYSQESVADYIPETLSAVTPGGTSVQVICYTLPPDKIRGTNKRYAKALLELVRQLRFPQSYIRQIEEAAA